MFKPVLIHIQPVPILGLFLNSMQKVTQPNVHSISLWICSMLEYVYFNPTDALHLQ